MFSELSVLALLQGVAILTIGAAAGYFLANFYFTRHRDRLQEDLTKTRAELDEYRKSVDRHFIKTSQLFNRLTDNYREIYEHLAVGAQDLCSQTAKDDAPHLEQPETRHLPAIEAGLAEPTVVSASAQEQADAMAQEDTAAIDREPPAVHDAAAEGGEPEPVKTAESRATLADSDEAVPLSADVPLAQTEATEEVPMGVEGAPAPPITRPALKTEVEDSGESGVSETAVEAVSDVDRHRSPSSIH